MDAFVLALERERPRRLQPDGVPHEPVRRLADQDLSRPGRLLEAGRDVHRVAGDEGLTVGRIADDHFARVHAGAELQLDALLLLELSVELIDGFVHLDHGSDGAERVVLVDRRDPEDGHDGIPDELLDGAAMVLDRPRRSLEVARHDAADGLGIQLRAEPRRLRDVGEDDRDRLACPGRGPR